MGACKKGPDFVLNTADCGTVEKDGDRVILHSGKLSAETTLQGNGASGFIGTDGC